MQLDETPAFLAANNLKPFLSRELLDSTKPIAFRQPPLGKAYGYKADILPEVCEVFLQARQADKLHYMQEPIAARCELLIRGFARVGINALVDEATGYQYARARQALEQILEKFIATELQKWQKTFPDDFYIEMYRLRDWKYDDVVPKKRPQVIGHITNDIVYQRLAPFVLDALREVTPRDTKGRRTERFHQHLTPEEGYRTLKEHLSAVVALVKTSSNWHQFMRLLDKALPKQNGMEPLFYPDEVDSEPAITRKEFETALRKVAQPN